VRPGEVKIPPATTDTSQTGKVQRLAVSRRSEFVRTRSPGNESPLGGRLPVWDVEKSRQAWPESPGTNSDSPRVWMTPPGEKSARG